MSIAVDRLVAKGLVSRAESAEDRRARIVTLTPRGTDLIVSAFRKHSGQMNRAFSELSREELRGLGVTLKKGGKRAAALMEESSAAPCQSAFYAPDRRLNLSAFTAMLGRTGCLLSRFSVRPDFRARLVR